MSKSLSGEAQRVFDDGVVAYRRGDMTRAVALLTQASSLAPDSAEVHFRLGMALFNSGQVKQAFAAFQRAYTLDPELTDAQQNAAAALQQLGRTGEARKIFQQILMRQPRNEMAWVGLADGYRAEGNQSEVAAALTKALEINPANAATRHMLNAATGQSPAQAERGYVADLFDLYAPFFDTHLVEKLHYVAPREVIQLLTSLYPAERFGAALDLGCGTGLLGVQLSETYRLSPLIGIDLSANMVKAADKRGVYTQTRRADILDYLHAPGPTFDLITATDVFIYVGDLTRVLSACATRLSLEGVVAFTVEQIDGNGFSLRPNGRYGHGRAYVEGAAAAAGFRIARMHEAPLRKHAAAPEMGLYFVLEKNAA